MLQAARLLARLLQVGEPVRALNERDHDRRETAKDCNDGRHDPERILVVFQIRCSCAVVRDFPAGLLWHGYAGGRRRILAQANSAWGIQFRWVHNLPR